MLRILLYYTIGKQSGQFGALNMDLKGNDCVISVLTVLSGVPEFVRDPVNGPDLDLAVKDLGSF